MWLWKDPGSSAHDASSTLGLVLATLVQTGLTGAGPVQREEDGVQTLLTSGSDAAPAPLQAGALTDEEVVARVRAGDTHLFEVLIRRYNQRLYRTVRAILQNDADAEDAVQQTYLNAYRHLAQFAGRAMFSTWLTRIAVYEALSRQRRARDRPLASGDDEQVEHAVSAAPDPERHTYAGELATLLESALAKLPHGYRSVFMLREIDGLNTAETAQQLRVSEGTVKTRLHRARDLLQRQLHNVTPAEAFRFGGIRCDMMVASVMSQLSGMTCADANRIGGE